MQALVDFSGWKNWTSLPTTSAQTTAATKTAEAKTKKEKKETPNLVGGFS